MERTSFPHSLAAGLLGLAVMVPCASAQVNLSVQANRISIGRGPAELQTLVRSTNKGAGTHWVITDAQGFAYSVGGYDADDGGGGGGSSSGGGGTSGGKPVIIVGGYDAALDYLRTTYGAIITRDASIGADLIEMPGREDPIAFFFQVLSADTFRGYPLYMFFQTLEVTSVGVFENPSSTAAKDNRAALNFPNDPLYRLQWNLQRTRLDLAQWHPTAAVKRAKIAIIDSGIGNTQRSHNGLDGTTIRHINVAPTSGSPTIHALELATMLADRSHEGDGVVGLAGRWGNSSCFPQPPLYAERTPEVRIYNVGDFGPISLYVARAIRMATQDGVDVINLSLHTAPSSVIESAIKAAQRAGVIVVASAGNYPSTASVKEARFPASMDGVISVGAAGSNLRPSSFSADAGVDIYAPGEDIVVGGQNGAWIYANGTSFAAPHVVATVALMRTANPDVTAAEALSAMQRYAIGQGSAPFLNALSALNAVLDDNARARYPTLAAGCSLPSILSGIFGKEGVDGGTNDGYAYDDRLDDDLFPAKTAGATLGLATELAVAPNPARGTARVAFSLDDAQRVRVAVYDALGREVALLTDGPLNAGLHQLTLNGAALGSGTYMVRMVTERGTFTRTVVILN